MGRVMQYLSYSMGWYTLHTLWGGILYIVYGVVYHTYSIEWYTVHTLWGGIPYILYGVVYCTQSMGWYTIHTLWGDIPYIVYGVVYCTYLMEWYTVHTLWGGIPYILYGVVYRNLMVGHVCIVETPLFHIYVRKIYCIQYFYIAVYITVVSVYLRNGLCHSKEVLDSRDMVFIIFIYYFMTRRVKCIQWE